jgi:hypothetical protein
MGVKDGQGSWTPTFAQATPGNTRQRVVQLTKAVVDSVPAGILEYNSTPSRYYRPRLENALPSAVRRTRLLPRRLLGHMASWLLHLARFKRIVGSAGEEGTGMPYLATPCPRIGCCKFRNPPIRVRIPKGGHRARETASLGFVSRPIRDPHCGLDGSWNPTGPRSRAISHTRIFSN